jgi:hypothetical protein
MPHRTEQQHDLVSAVAHVGGLFLYLGQNHHRLLGRYAGEGRMRPAQLVSQHQNGDVFFHVVLYGASHAVDRLPEGLKADRLRTLSVAKRLRDTK